MKFFKFVAGASTFLTVGLIFALGWLALFGNTFRDRTHATASGLMIAAFVFAAIAIVSSQISLSPNKITRQKDKQG